MRMVNARQDLIQIINNLMKTLAESFSSGDGYLIIGRKLPLGKIRDDKNYVETGISSQGKVLG